jgi:hypothetical protein
MDVKFLSTKWGAFADDPSSPLLDMGNEAAWDRMYKRELEDFRRRQRAKLVASTPHLREDNPEPAASPSKAR